MFEAVRVAADSTFAAERCEAPSALLSLCASLPSGPETRKLVWCVGLDCDTVQLPGLMVTENN